MKYALVAAPLLAVVAVAGPVEPAAAQTSAVADDRPDYLTTAADRTLALNNLIATVRAQHFSAVEGGRIARQIERRMRAGRYDRLVSARALAALLTDDLRALSGDKHFLVDYFARARPFPATEDATSTQQQRQEAAMTNHGVAAAQRLDGNIGYLRIDRFGPVDGAGPVLLAAMAMLASTDALIVDLRRNGGGHGETVALLAAQFLPEPTRLSDVIGRDMTKQSWTPPVLTGRYLDKPVYVLTSSRTFSAAEAFGYDLQALGRAKIVGETTRGGANPVNRVLLSSRFWALVPVARVRNAVTGGNWEGTGVRPDIVATAEAALATAQRDAARRLLVRHPDDPLTRELEALIGAP